MLNQASLTVIETQSALLKTNSKWLSSVWMANETVNEPVNEMCLPKGKCHFEIIMKTKTKMIITVTDIIRV